MKKLTYKGKDVKAVKRGKNCDDCIFYEWCNNGYTLTPTRWETESEIRGCQDTDKKYLYK
jgi:hypothetical protein